MQKPDDSLLLVHEHLVSVYMDLIEFDDEDQYREKLDILKESYFNGVSEVDETVTDNNTSVASGTVMDTYMSSLTRAAKVRDTNKIT